MVKNTVFPQTKTKSLIVRINNLRQKMTKLATNMDMLRLWEIGAEIQALAELPASEFVSGERNKLKARIKELEWQLESSIRGKIPNITATIIRDQREKIEELENQLYELKQCQN